MPIDYEINSHLRGVSAVIDEYVAWYVRFVKFAFYTMEAEGGEYPPLPDSFTRWAELERGGIFIESETLDSIAGLHQKLQSTVDTLERRAAEAATCPDAPLFDAVTMLFEQLMARLRRLEQECLMINGGIDPLTGLRHRCAMEIDLEKEMEKLARQGRPFAMVLAHADLRHEKNSLSPAEYRKAIQGAAGLIKKCVRSFDDAYRSGDCEFIMILRQSDLRGGSAAVARMQGFLQEEPVHIRSKEGNMKNLDMVYCVAEPLPGESMDELLRNMRDDLRKHDVSEEKTLEYIEQSPLQRFLKDVKGGQG